MLSGNDRSFLEEHGGRMRRNQAGEEGDPGRRNGAIREEWARLQGRWASAVGRARD